MKNDPKSYLFAAGLALAGLACTKSERVPAPAPRASADEALLPPGTEPVPSEAEADAAANAAIKAENADAELEKLKSELEEGG